MRTRIRNTYARADGEAEMMSMEESKKWLQKFDSHGDGRITMKELLRVIEDNGTSFSRWHSKSKANPYVVSEVQSKSKAKPADDKCNGVIDENKIAKLVEFANKELGLKIVAA